MCNDRTAEQNIEWLKRRGLLSRRDFAKLGLGAAFIAALPAAADALNVMEQDVTITTPDVKPIPDAKPRIKVIHEALALMRRYFAD